MGKSFKAKELIEKRYGKRGTDFREKFRDEAFSFYFGEIIIRDCNVYYGLG